MLGNGGELDGKRILAPASVKLMATNHLAPELLTGQYGIGLAQMRPGFGYGYNGAVEFDPQAANLPDGKGTFTGMAPPVRGSGSIPPTTWCSWA